MGLYSPTCSLRPDFEPQSSDGSTDCNRASNVINGHLESISCAQLRVWRSGFFAASLGPEVLELTRPKTICSLDSVAIYKVLTRHRWRS